MPLWEIITGRDCNMRCSYCYAGEKRALHNTPEQVTAFLSSAYAEYLKKKVQDPPRLSFIGGEPLLHPEIIDAALAFYHEQSVRNHLPEVPSSIITNGTLIGESEEVRALLERWRGKLRLSFSIDGNRETHDACRKDAQGQGTWDRAIAGYHAAREIIGNASCSAKATFSRETVKAYAEGVIELFNQGFSRVNANVMAETDWPEETAGYVFSLFLPVMNWLLERGRYKRHRLRQLSEPTETKLMTQNHACSYLRDGSMCLGLDGIVYGCHRAAVSAHLHPYGKVVSDGVEVIDADLLHRARDVWRLRPQKCRACSLGSVCFGCVNSAFMYDYDDPGAFFRAYSPCGWTKGVYAAQLEFARRVRDLGG